MEVKQSKSWLIVIEKDIKLEDGSIVDFDIDRFVIFLKTSCEFYAYNLHDKDINENSELVRPHYHFVVKLKKRTRKSSLINIISKFCDVSPEVIGVRYDFNITLSIRYLVHYDNKDKHQYDFYKIESSSRSFVFSCLDLDMEQYEITASYLSYLIIDLNTPINVLLTTLGINTFQKYYKAISLLYRYGGRSSKVSSD